MFWGSCLHVHDLGHCGSQKVTRTNGHFQLKQTNLRLQELLCFEIRLVTTFHHLTSPDALWGHYAWTFGLLCWVTNSGTIGHFRLNWVVLRQWDLLGFDIDLEWLATSTWEVIQDWLNNTKGIYKLKLKPSTMKLVQIILFELSKLVCDPWQPLVTHELHWSVPKACMRSFRTKQMAQNRFAIWNQSHQQWNWCKIIQSKLHKLNCNLLWPNTINVFNWSSDIAHRRSFQINQKTQKEITNWNQSHQQWN